MKYVAILLLLAAGVVLSAAALKPPRVEMPTAAKAILDNAATLDLYSLEPDGGDKPAGTPDTLHGWKILGKATLKTSDEAGKRLLTAWKKAIAKGSGAKCFDPRHAIRAEHDGKKVDIVICFHCGWAYVHLDGKDAELVRLEVDSKAQPLFDKLLKEAKVPLAKKAD